jgi:hypothetical protein
MTRTVSDKCCNFCKNCFQYIQLETIGNNLKESNFCLSTRLSITDFSQIVEMEQQSLDDRITTEHYLFLF